MAGILRHVSVGYTIEQWRDDTDPTTGERIRSAVAWTPVEISLVPTPADPGTTIRQGGTMSEIDTPSADAPASPPADHIETCAAINAEIRSIARIAGLGTGFADGLIDNSATAEGRRAVFEALAARDGTIRPEQVRVEVGASEDDPSVRARHMGEALYARINPQHQLSEPARRYVYATCAEMARELLTLRRHSVTGLSPATRALHTTSDFPLIVGDTIAHLAGRLSGRAGRRSPPRPAGARKAGSTRMIHAAGFSGIAATTWDAGCRTRMRAKSNAGRRSGATSHKSSGTANRAIRCVGRRHATNCKAFRISGLQPAKPAYIARRIGQKIAQPPRGDPIFPLCSIV
jgi:hypothetical protein